MVDVDTANVRCFTNLEREGLMRIFFVALRAIGTHAFALDMGMYALLLTGDGLEVLHYFVDLAGQRGAKIPVYMTLKTCRVCPNWAVAADHDLVLFTAVSCLPSQAACA